MGGCATTPAPAEQGKALEKSPKYALEPAAMHGGSASYPGEIATAAQIKLLADEYRGGAHDLLSRGRKGQPSSWAPACMSPIHAIELYLNALLLHKGHAPAEIRGYQNDLAKRARSEEHKSEHQS